MLIENTLFPHLGWLVAHQREVLWIYLVLLLCILVRVWLTLQLLALPRERRAAFLERMHTLSEVTINIPVLFGVLGTLIGITMAVAGRSGETSPAEFMTLFSQAFGVAVYTTIAGGLTHTVCFIVSWFDDLLAGASP